MSNWHALIAGRHTASDDDGLSVELTVVVSAALTSLELSYVVRPSSKLLMVRSTSFVSASNTQQLIITITLILIIIIITINSFFISFSHWAVPCKCVYPINCCWLAHCKISATLNYCQSTCVSATLMVNVLGTKKQFTVSYPMRTLQIALKSVIFTHFRLPWPSPSLTLAYRHVSLINLYLHATFVWTGQIVCGQMDGWTRSQAVARIADRTASQHLWLLRDIIDHMTIWYSICHFLLVVLWNGVSIYSLFKILRSKHIGVRSLTFQGHVTSSVTWPFDSPYAISY